MFRHQEGQGFVEYALVLALVTVVIIVILALLGPAIRNVNVATPQPPATISAFPYPYERVSIDGYPQLGEVNGELALLFWAKETGDEAFALYMTAPTSRKRYDAQPGDCFVIGDDAQTQTLVFHLSHESC